MKAVLGVMKDSLNLLATDTGEPLKEVIDGRSI